MTGVLLLGAANAAAVLAALAISARLRTGEAAVDLALALLIKILLVSAAVLAAGWGGFLTPLGLGLPACAALAILAARRSWRRRPSLPWGSLSGLTRAAVLLVALRAVAQAWFFAPFSGDALGYHLPKIAEWVRAGAFTRAMGVDDLVTLPAGFELLEAWWVLFLRHDALIEVAGLEFLALGAVAVAGLGRRMGLSPDASVWAGLLYAITPGPALQAVGGLNDGPVAALVLATLLLIDARVHPGLVALAAGLATGIKGTYVYAALPLAALWLPRDRRPAVLAGTGRTAWALAAIAVVVGGSWYARNAAWYGNPFHPVGPDGYEGEYQRIQAGPRLGSLTGNAGAYLGRFVLDGAEAYAPQLPESAGLGPLGFACGTLALLASLRAGAFPAGWAAALACSAGFVFLMSAPNAWIGRFVLFLAGPAALAVVWAAGRGRTLAALVAVLAAAQLALGTLPSVLSRERLAALARRDVGRRSLDGVFYPGLPEEGRIGFWTDYRAPQYLLYGPRFRRDVVPLRPDGPGDLPGLIARERLDAVVVDARAFWLPRALDALVDQGALRKLGPRVYAPPLRAQGTQTR